MKDKKLSKGLERMRRRFEAIPNEIKAELAVAHYKNGKVLTELQKEWVPELTSEMRRAIKFRVTVSPSILTVTADKFYASFVEFGTRENQAKPFFFPAYRVLRRRMKSRFTRHMKKAIKRAAKKQ